MQQNLDDLSTVDLEEVLDTTESRLGCTLQRKAGHYSAHNGSAGFPTAAGTWVRLAWRRPDRLNGQRWTGFEAAAALTGVPRPEWFAAASWTDTRRGVVWRADEMTHIPARSISHRADLGSDPNLPERWWTDLRAALDALGGHTTDRLCMSQAHLTARIREIYGDTVDTAVTDWACAHGDLGWANLCGPDLAVLDWEDWGNAPVGLDAACLWAASLPQPAVAEKVLDLFADVLTSRSGRLSRLLLCANTARAYKRTGTLGPLTDAMARTADELLAELT
ncbi:aminoglycoside phosphotransferase [Kitasatospora sp. NPDC059327]|uniref:aminoglycoside phosphotransferase n=1 Tax=Kitasatospora sp. NPDC059327 TaxID=3346803 RepID=UPI00367D8A00